MQGFHSTLYHNSLKFLCYDLKDRGAVAYRRPCQYSEAYNRSREERSGRHVGRAIETDKDVKSDKRESENGCTVAGHKSSAEAPEWKTTAASTP